MGTRSSLSMTVDLSARLATAITQLTKREVLIGIPADGAQRVPTPGEKTPPSNALIGYVMETGDDERHIPARPFLVPGIESARVAITTQLTKTGEKVLTLTGDASKLSVVDQGLNTVGLIGQKAVQKTINDGPFAPLAPGTIAGRARRGRRGAQQYIKLASQGVPTDVLNDPGVGLVKPLIDTSQLLQSITYVVHDKGSEIT